MGKSRGSLTYRYQVNIDMTKIVEKMIDALLGENVEWDFDGSTLTIVQSLQTKYEASYCKATMWEPAESEIYLDEDVNFVDIDGDIRDALREVTKDDIDSSVIVQDETEWDFGDEYDGPDPDRAYEEWKDERMREK